MLQCYNRGCGKKYNPNENTDECCLHHPGEPYFHDAYKGWTCCNKKSVDFTEFLNMKGCTQSKHSNDKPPEPVKQEKPVEIYEPIDEIRKPIPMKRPAFNTPLVTIKPKVTAALKNAIDALQPTPTVKKISVNVTNLGAIENGTSCKHGGCLCTYSANADETICEYHPGTPIFHEGMKYWSCCQKKTSDFTAFMNQKGCTVGKHKWIKDDDESKTVNCRYDWHQTATDVIIALYARLYHYDKSKIQINPIRLMVSLIFPEQNDLEFHLDLELRGIIKVEESKVTMNGSKVEITLPKAEPGSWAKLETSAQKKPETPTQQIENLTNQDSDSDVDLDDLEPVNMGAKLANIL